MLRRYRMPLLRHLDQSTGLPVRRPAPRRYEHDAPGDLIHVDIKKLGRIPDGGGHRKLGRTIGDRHNKKQRPDYAFLHHAVDDHSRLAYSEILSDERKETAAAFWDRANTFFESYGIAVKRVLTDNGACSRSGAFAEALGPDIKHKKTRPYRPQTNGKVKRFNRTLGSEWAYRGLHLRGGARRNLQRLAPPLQSPPNPLRHRRTHPDGTPTRSQPTRALQLATLPCRLDQRDEKPAQPAE